MTRKRLANPVLFICDIQERFRTAIWECSKVINTTQKMVKAANQFSIPIYATTQNAARLGQTVPEIRDLFPSTVHEHDKTAFSMVTPTIADLLSKQSSSGEGGGATGGGEPLSIIIVGIESHICVTQTTLDLLGMGHKVYVLADGVSSCNAGERPVALARLAREGATVTTSESVLFELLEDAGSKEFKGISGIVKETKEDTKGAVEVLCGKL